MKPLAEMTRAELRMEMDAAIKAETAADYIDNLTAWQRERQAARDRQQAVMREIERRNGRKVDQSNE